MTPFSVLASVYYKEKPEYLRAALNSVVEQTVKPSEIVLVEDGELTDELYAVIEEFFSSNKGLLKTVKLEKNGGLGVALAKGLVECSNELIARADTDDICRKDRFELQLKELEVDP